MDRVSKTQRSWNMSRIRGHDTAPERLVRSSLHRMGLRFRLQGLRLPGKPDVVLTRHRIAIFVHGCFWHRHPGCKYTYVPKSHKEFWSSKFAANRARDRRVCRQLRVLGWRTVVIWECDTLHEHRLLRVLRGKLKDLVAGARSRVERRRPRT